MHRIVPDFILENYRAGRYQGSFEAAGLYVDLSGFSILTDALMGQGREGAEALAVTMRAVFDPVVEAIFGHGGMIVGYAGDSIGALFPIEADEAAAARRALAAAHAIQQGLRRHPLFATPYGEFHIAARVGLSIGAVAWGILRSAAGERAVYYFRGAALEEAIRAEQAAAPAEIMLTGSIRQRLADGIETVPSAELHLLQGVSGPLPAAIEVNLPPVDAAAAAVFAPREVITQDLRGEFRQTVQMFMQIPDLTHDQLQQFILTVFELQRRYGGLLERVDFGDKGCNLVALWGAPVAHENDIDRALNFTLELQSAVDLPVTAGVTYYVSHSGYIGGRLFEAYTAYGWGMTLAARFMAQAASRDVWLDERIVQRTAERFHAEHVGEHKFKGFAQKQKVYVLRGRKSAWEALFRGQLVGRAAELQALTDFVAPLWEGAPAGVLGIWGEAGIGKSRLVYEFRRSPLFEAHQCLWALCQSDEILRTSFSALRYWLVRYFGITPEQEAAARARNLSAKMDDLIAHTARESLAGELRRAVAFLAGLVDVDWPDPASAQLDAQGRYDNTILALISLLKAESRRQPLILFMEDAQNLDEDSRAFVPRLKRALAADPVSYPIAILMAARWQGAAVLLEQGLVDHEMELSGLPADSITLLSREFLGGPPSATLSKLVNERAEGNPFFAEQIVRYLQEQGLLELDRAGDWSLKPAGRSQALPADISAMLVARLDKLSPQVKQVIQAASVLGRTFDLPVLRRMLPPATSVQPEVVAAEQAAIWSPVSETRWIFNHALLRDVAYGMQLQSRRQELHALAFAALEELYRADARRHYGELAFHSEQAALAPEALRYLSLAGDAARLEYEDAQALQYYRRALALVPDSEPGEQYRLHRLCQKIVAEHNDLDESDRELQTLQALADAAGEPARQAEVLWLRSLLENARGEYQQAAASAEAARDLALEHERFDVAIGAQWALLTSFAQRGLYKDAVEHGEAGLELARLQHATSDEAYILNGLGLAFMEMKNPSTARTYFERSLDIFQGQADRRGLARVLANLGTVSGYQGNYRTALDYCEQALRLAREIGSRRGECLLLGNLGWISGLMGDYHKARDYAERNLRIAREIGDRYNENVTLVNLSGHAGALGEIASAIEYAEQGLALARQSNDRNLQAWALTYLGHGLFESGRLEEARTTYREALEVRRSLDQPALATEPEAGLARILSALGETEHAREHVEAILVQLEQDGTLEGTDHPLRVYLNCYLVLTALADPRARSIINTAHDMLKTRANGIAEPSARQLFLENITYNKEIMSLWEQRH